MHTALLTVLPRPRRGAPGGQLLRTGKWLGTLDHALLGAAQPSLPGQGPDPRCFPPCREERDNVLGGGGTQSLGQWEAMSSTRGSVAQRLGTDSQAETSPRPGPPRHRVQVCPDTCVRALGQGGAGWSGNTSPGPGCAAAQEGAPFFSNSPESLPKPWLSPCCLLPKARPLGLLPRSMCSCPCRQASPGPGTRTPHSVPHSVGNTPPPPH